MLQYSENLVLYQLNHNFKAILQDRVSQSFYITPTGVGCVITFTEIIIMVLLFCSKCNYVKEICIPESIDATTRSHFRDGGKFLEFPAYIVNTEINDCCH